MTYTYCPVCGKGLKYEKCDRQIIPICQNPSCGFVFWQNSKPCVAAIISNNQDHILMTIRAHEPDQGKIDLPGGFLQEGEHPNAGVKREIKEELGVEIDVFDYLGFIIDRYGENGDYTLNIGMIAKITSGIPQAADDAAELRWIDPQNITPDQLAFTNNQKFLQLWLAHSDSKQ